MSQDRNESYRLVISNNQFKFEVTSDGQNYQEVGCFDDLMARFRRQIDIILPDKLPIIEKFCNFSFPAYSQSAIPETVITAENEKNIEAQFLCSRYSCKERKKGICRLNYRLFFYLPKIPYLFTFTDEHFYGLKNLYPEKKMRLLLAYNKGRYITVLKPGHDTKDIIKKFNDQKPDVILKILRENFNVASLNKLPKDKWKELVSYISRETEGGSN